MAQFKIGDKVIRISDNEHGIVTNVLAARGRIIYTVSFANTENKVLEADLRANFDVVDPFERCKNGIFGSYSDFANKNTTFKIHNSNNSTISSLKASKTLFRAYQFKPLLKFLNSPSRRLLVADEVGLGKTIEAGHIMLELKARRELTSVLIVCPKSLQEKWKAELLEKFGLNFKIVDSVKDLISDLRNKPETVKAIINYEKIRKNRDIPEEKNGNLNPNNLIDFLTMQPQRFSLVLCDEAHKMRNRDTKTYKGAEVLMDCADSALFLTATPVMIDEENLYNLLHLLDNSRFYNLEIFRNRLNENKPFIEAISSLNHNKPFDTILDELKESEVSSCFFIQDRQVFSRRTSIGDLYADDPVFGEITELLSGMDTLKVRARLQYLLSSMSAMNTIFSRTRKREVTTDMSQAERCPHVCKVLLTEQEQEEYDQVIQQYINDNIADEDYGDESMTQGAALGLVQRKRQIASSVWAYLNNEDDLDAGKDAYADCDDSKVNELVRVIRTVFNSGVKKIVIFALFRKTLKYLQIRLNKAGYNALVIHGKVDCRAEIIHQFKTDDKIHILLSSEVGSEGLDMQFCNSMVNYDLPWNPMVVEQRIGRIDRFGQKSPVVNIYNFIVADSIQETIYMRLLKRIGIFKGTIGDLEAILDAQIKVEGRTMTIQDVYNKMERDFFTKDLTEEEKERKIEEVERAIQNEKVNLQNLQEGLSNTLTNDAYFQEEINKILYKNAYVTKEELENFLQTIVRQYLTTCNLEKVDNEIWEFSIPKSQPKILNNFLSAYVGETEDDQNNVAQFKRWLDDKLSFRFTFNQETAYDNPTICYLNIYHPLIQASLRYFIANEDETKTSFSFALPADELLHEGERYYMGVYKLKSSRMVQGVIKETTVLYPVLYNLQNQEVEKNGNIVDRLLKRSQVEGYERNASNEDTDSSIIDGICLDFSDIVSHEIKKRIDEENRQIESDRLRNEQQANEYYNSRINNIKDRIREWYMEIEYLPVEESEKKKGSIRMFEGQIMKLENERKERLKLINEDKQLKISDQLISLNLITII